jgi:electron transport complex protein RnfC
MKLIRALFACRGGVHPPYHKLTSGKPIETMPVPTLLRVSMAQHLGAPSRLTAKKGDLVLKGQPLAEGTGYVSAWVHSPVSGVIRNIDEMLTSSGRFATVIEMESDGRETLHESCKPRPDWEKLEHNELMELLTVSGIVGMGGAGFPTQVKLSPPPEKTVDTLIINGAECEPYLTADDRLMVEHADRVWKGARIIQRLLNASRVVVAIEENKPAAIGAMGKVMASTPDAELLILKTEYPQGAEKQLIAAATGREVPSGGLPMDVGAVVENVATAAAIYDMIAGGMPLLERVMTVSGDGVSEPKNVLVRMGTSLQAVVDFCGGVKGTPAKILSGGTMMGLALTSLEAGTSKTNSGLLLLSKRHVSVFEATPCISCGRCVDACPVGLLPCTLGELMEAEDYEAAEGYDVMDCIECGCCAFECPAHRPLVQHMRMGKGRVLALRRQRDARKKGAK